MKRLGRIWHAPRGILLDLTPAVLYFGLLFWAGLIPLESLPGPDFALADKMWHLIAFGGLAALLARVVRHFRRPALQAAAIGAGASALLGGAQELLQSLTAYRSADAGDFAADALGALLAYVGLRALARAAGIGDAVHGDV